MDTEPLGRNEDKRTPDQVRYDAICDQVVEATKLVKILSEQLERSPPGQVQTVIHKTEGMGAVGIVCASICALCAILVVVGVIVLHGDMRDLWAWKDIHSNDIAALKADVKQIKERK